MYHPTIFFDPQFTMGVMAGWLLQAAGVGALLLAGALVLDRGRVAPRDPGAGRVPGARPGSGSSCSWAGSSGSSSATSGPAPSAGKAVAHLPHQHVGREGLLQPRVPAGLAVDPRGPRSPDSPTCRARAGRADARAAAAPAPGRWCPASPRR